MKPRTVIPVVSLIVAALAGLIVLQVHLLNNAFTLKEQAFRQNVTAALGAAALKLQAGETISRVMRYGPLPGHRGGPGHRVNIRVFSDPGGDALVRDTTGEPENYIVRADTFLSKKEGYTYGYFTDSASMVLRVGQPARGEADHTSRADRDRLFVVSAVYDDLLSEKTGIERKINPALLDSVLKASMREAGITLPFAYGVLSARKDSVLLAAPASAEQDLRASEFRVPLFPLAFGPPQGNLAVCFSGRDAYLISQLWPALVASILFIVIIALGFTHTVRTIVRQQRLSARMVEFINNMTHEFKTPIATVTLASEAIQRPDVIRSGSRVRKYNKMIAEEMLRMKSQVDRILQMAVIEEGDFELSLADVDMHEVIRTAVESAVLHVGPRGGSIRCALGADRHTIRGDAVHIANILNNLLDNAAKYSRGAPEIRISTADEKDRLLVRVSDRGIGIAPEHVERVFDKYYRVPTGNLHETRGFGLGLSYVRLLVEAHGGTISLKSRPGAGTDVELRFPESPSP